MWGGQRGMEERKHRFHWQIPLVDEIAVQWLKHWLHPPTSSSVGGGLAPVHHSPASERWVCHWQSSLDLLYLDSEPSHHHTFFVFFFSTFDWSLLLTGHTYQLCRFLPGNRSEDVSTWALSTHFQCMSEVCLVFENLHYTTLILQKSYISISLCQWKSIQEGFCFTTFINGNHFFIPFLPVKDFIVRLYFWMAGETCLWCQGVQQLILKGASLWNRSAVMSCKDASEHTALNQEDLLLWRPAVLQFEFILCRMTRHSLKMCRQIKAGWQINQEFINCCDKWMEYIKTIYVHILCMYYILLYTFIYAYISIFMYVHILLYLGVYDFTSLYVCTSFCI